MVAVVGMSGFHSRGQCFDFMPCLKIRMREIVAGFGNCPVDALVTIRVGFRQMSNVTGGQQDYVKVDKTYA
jgi:hypothetical protein